MEKKLVRAIIIFLLSALAVPNAVGATNITVLFDDNEYGAPFKHADWIGTIDLGQYGTGFYAKIGECSFHVDCIYDQPYGDSPFKMLGSSGFHINVDGETNWGTLATFPSSRQWNTSAWPGIFQHGGTYCGVGYDQGCAVPEPSAFGLLLIGLAFLARRLN